MQSISTEKIAFTREEKDRLWKYGKYLFRRGSLNSCCSPTVEVRAKPLSDADVQLIPTGRCGAKRNINNTVRLTESEAAPLSPSTRNTLRNSKPSDRNASA